MSGDDDRPGVAPIWGIVFAFMLVMLAMLIWMLISAINWEAVLRFIAPTAFETRSIEEILEGGSP